MEQISQKTIPIRLHRAIMARIYLAKMIGFLLVSLLVIIVILSAIFYI